MIIIEQNVVKKNVPCAIDVKIVCEEDGPVHDEEY